MKKIDLPLLLTLAISLGGIIYTYGALSERVNGIEQTTDRLVEFADDLAVLQAKMDLIEKVADRMMMAN